MADQTIAFDGDSGSKQNVAFKLWDSLRYLLPDVGEGEAAIKQNLDLYATCLTAANFGWKSRLSEQR